MNAEAVSAGFAQTENFGQVPRFQIVTIEDISERYKLPRLPGVDEQASFKKAKPENSSRDQGALDL